MSCEELQVLIEKKKSELTELQQNSKTRERELQEKKELLEKQKSDLLKAIKARIQLIDMLKKDIIRMAYEESCNAIQQDFEKSTSSSNSLPQLQSK